MEQQPETLKVLVCGSRDWEDYDTVLERLKSLPTGIAIIEGAAKGADTMAKTAAQELGLSVIEVPADWKRYGRAAGPIRNKEMLDLEPALVIAFHKDITASKGTANCVEEARKRDIPVEIVT